MEPTGPALCVAEVNGEPCAIQAIAICPLCGARLCGSHQVRRWIRVNDRPDFNLICPDCVREDEHRGAELAAATRRADASRAERLKTIAAELARIAPDRLRDCSDRSAQAWNLAIDVNWLVKNRTTTGPGSEEYSSSVSRPAGLTIGGDLVPMILLDGEGGAGYPLLGPGGAPTALAAAERLEQALSKGTPVRPDDLPVEVKWSILGTLGRELAAHDVGGHVRARHGKNKPSRVWLLSDPVPGLASRADQFGLTPGGSVVCVSQGKRGRYEFFHCELRSYLRRPNALAVPLNEMLVRGSDLARASGIRLPLDVSEL